MTQQTGMLVSDEAFEYLRIQKGSLDRFASQRKLWEKAYRSDLETTYNEIRPFLPAACWGLLDIGSGLGGIDVLLSRHYAQVQGRPPFVNLLDGEADAPVMRVHRETFNDMRVARNFLTANGIKPEHFDYYTPTAFNLPKPYDLVVSFGSWCFHYPPDVYLPLLLSGGGLHADSVLIVDVRNEALEYAQQLSERMRIAGVIRQARKYTRLAYKLKKQAAE